MKKLLYMIVVLLSAVVCSCGDDEKGILVGELYEFNVPDTLLSASAHDFTLTLHSIDASIETPDWWTYFSVGWCYDDSLIERSSNKWMANETDCTKQDGVWYMDWIRLERVETGGTPDMRVIVKPNETDEYRALNIVISYSPPEWENVFDTGTVVIVQEPAHI